MSAENILEALTDNIEVDKSKCIFCGRCAETCILDNIRLYRAPCAAACPLGLNIQGYVQLVARGKDEQARAIIAERLPFPQLVCRICDHPCEQACNRNRVDGSAVNINGIKRFLFAGRKMEEIACKAASGKRVAIVGSGPAGLLAAHDLRREGHEVTIHEAAAKAGGLLRSLLPVWKMPESVLDEIVETLGRAGVHFLYGRPLGNAAALDRLLHEHDAVILALGAGEARKAGIEGENLPHVLSAFDFLRDVRAGHADGLKGHCVVVGGGYVALDCAQAAMRQGADSVTVMYRRTVDTFHTNREDIALAKQMGIRFDFTWNVTRIGTGNGRLGLTCGHDMKLLPQACLDYPSFDPDEIRTTYADTVIMAVGQEKDAQLPRLAATEAVDPVTLQVGGKALFVAGDMEQGPSSAIRAMASGRRAATSIIRLFAGEDLAYGRQYPGPYVDEFEVAFDNAAALPRQEGIGHDCEGKGDFRETTRFLTEQMARAEASRCLSCGGPSGHHRTCWFCLPCEVECPEQALHVNIPYLLR